MRAIRPLLAGALSLLALAACDPGTVRTSPAPAARPAAAGPAEPSAESKALAAYYARIEQSYRAQGLLRTDGGGPDTPVTRRQLVQNFVKIALYEEFSRMGGNLVARETESRLHRWQSPVRMNVIFGDSVPEARRDEDRRAVAGYAARLSRISGLPITQSASGANYHVFIVNEDERRAIGPQLRAIMPDISPEAIATVEGLPRTTLCLVFARDSGESGIYTQAIAIIRAEHPDLLRLSCIHEELAQGLGLANDSPAARPSIFNDDEEFGLLTTHDEMLLRMLYDRRLRPGMSAAEARPIAEIIAAELLGGET